MLLFVLFFTLATPALSALHEKKIHGDAIWDTKSVVDESMRRRIFEERHGSWPDPKWLEDEPPGYQARMKERTAAAMATQDSQQRWDEWMFLSQVYTASFGHLLFPLVGTLAAYFSPINLDKRFLIVLGVYLIHYYLPLFCDLPLGSPDAQIYRKTIRRREGT